jgi:hypothetical protein
MDQTPTTPAVQVTRTNPAWRNKLVIIGVVVFFFGLWGLYDALVVYPNRGKVAAEYFKWQYLQQVAGSGSVLSASEKDPVGKLAQLRAVEGGPRTERDRSLLAWLDALSMVNMLSPEHTTLKDPSKELDELTKYFTTAAGQAKEAPKPLSKLDIPVQWLICALGVGIGTWMFITVARISARKYRWDPAELRLTLPDGNSLVPADIEDFDKRKWDKFMIYLKVRPGHTTLAGREVTMDLYPHVPLEDWVLQMEKAAFPERAAEAPTAETADKPAA